MEDISDVFSFSRAYFMVDTEAPVAVVDFLRPLMPRKSKTELYPAIGFQKFVDILPGLKAGDSYGAQARH